MNNNCKYAQGGHCLCSACQAVRKAMEDAEKITKEEVEEVFRDAERLLKQQEGGAEG